MKQKLFLLFFILLIPSVLFSASVFDDFNSHQWYDPALGYGSWQRKTVVSWTTFDGRECLKAISTTTAFGAMYITSKRFSDEIWQDVELIRAEVYLDSEDNTTDLKIEPKNHSDGTIDGVYFNNLDTGTWVDCVWDINTGATKVAVLSIIPDNLGTSDCTFYFDNIRLIKTNGTTWYWEDFKQEPHNWGYNGSYVSWNSNMDVVTHNESTSTANTGSGYLQWQYNSFDDWAELSLGGIDEDWTAYNTLKADIWCSTTTIPLKCWFYFGAKGLGENSSYRYVSSSETWQTVYWPLPASTTAWNVTEFKPGLGNINLIQSGTYYIDNITLGAVNFSAYKSTDAAFGAPDDQVNVTITYQNTGDMEATNIYLTDVVPINTYIPEAAAAGNADALEYYVGSSWQGGYDASCTRIRFKDNYLGAGVTGQQVTYKLQVR